MKIRIINGPNLNLLGSRDSRHYGTSTLQDLLDGLREAYPDISFSHFQSNVEGELVTAIQEAYKIADAIILNGAAYTHTSVALADAVEACGIPVVEVHISNVFSREDFRHVSFPGRHCIGTIAGFGFDSYHLAVEAIRRRLAGA